MGLKLTFPRTDAPKTLALEYVQYYEDGFAYYRGETSPQTFEPEWTVGWTWVPIRYGPPGRYWVYVYDGDRKVAEVEYEVVP